MTTSRLTRIVPPVAATMVLLASLTTSATAVGAQSRYSSVWSADTSRSTRGVELEAVSADRPKDAWAVGTRIKAHASHAKAAVQEWNGRTWRNRPAPADAQELTSVSAASPKSVYAAGYADLFNGTTKVWHWNGRKWTRLSSAGLPAVTGAIATTGPKVWLVGGVDSGRRDGGAVIATYHPKRHHWSVLRVASGGFIGATVVNAHTAWAVGGDSVFAGAGHPIVAHWNGHTWSTQTLSDVSGQLTSIASHGSDDALAVGQHDSGAGSAEHWDGDSWTAVALRDPAFQQFSSVAAAGASSYWGSTRVSGNKHTVYEKYEDGDWGPRVNGDRAPKRRTFSNPRTFALAHVPGTHRTLAVGVAEGYASETSPPTINAWRESTTH